MKARFLTQQPQVKTIESGGKTYVFLCLHEEHGSEEFDGNQTEYFEYDYNEFYGESLNVEDIREHPEKYIDYIPDTEKSLEETIAAQKKDIELLKDCLLEISEDIYA